jgi:hypothetical protein
MRWGGNETARQLHRVLPRDVESMAPTKGSWSTLSLATVRLVNTEPIGPTGQNEPTGGNGRFSQHLVTRSVPAMRSPADPNRDASRIFETLNPHEDRSEVFARPAPGIQPIESKPWKHGNHSNTGWKSRKHAGTQFGSEVADTSFNEGGLADELLAELDAPVPVDSPKFNGAFLSV